MPAREWLGVRLLAGVLLVFGWPGGASATEGAGRGSPASAAIIPAAAAMIGSPFPASAWPVDAPALIALGRLLFYDPALSVNGTLACAGCHSQALAFSDGRAVAVGATGQLHSRNVPSLSNLAYASSLGWSNPLLWQLEAQHRAPLFGQAPVEMGLSDPLPQLLRTRLRSQPRYVRAWAALRPPHSTTREAPQLQPALDETETLLQALAAFVRSLVSFDSTFDRWLYRDNRQALSADAQAGFALFTSSRLGCAECHRGFLLGGAVRTRNRQQPPEFFNTGVGRAASTDRGLAAHTGRATDTGKFRVPSLRNVALTAPYMHDGSLQTLDAVLDHYSSAGQGGGGTAHPTRPTQLRAFVLAGDERRQLLAFLQALTDRRFVTAPEHSDPWADAPVDPCADPCAEPGVVPAAPR